MDSTLDEYRKAFAALGRAGGYKLVEMHKSHMHGNYYLEYDCMSSDHRLTKASVFFVLPDGYQKQHSWQVEKIF